MNNENINRLVDETLNSLDGAKRAVARPFLFTRITGKMQPAETRMWDNALRFISRPAVAMACILFVLAVNMLVFTFNRPSVSITGGDEQYTTIADDYRKTVTGLNDLENLEP